MCIRDRSKIIRDTIKKKGANKGPLEIYALGNCILLLSKDCLLYTSDAADERSSVDLGGRRIIKKKKNIDTDGLSIQYKKKMK